MQVDGEQSLPAGDEDDHGSLFGSPPPSPARGRSPQLALPASPGSAENVGTVALPGSHYCSELAIDPAVLLLNPPVPPRNPDPPTTAHLTPPSTSTSISPSHRPAKSRVPSRAARNSKNGKERSTTPHPPPPIHFPDPDDPLPSNFLRSQQALLGHAGLIGGLDPSTLSTRYHKGATSRNPIIIEDELDPPPLGKQGIYPLDSSSLPPPSSEEVVSSLVKQRNIFPVLESLLRLLSGTGVPATSPTTTSYGLAPSNSNGSSSGRGPAPKRRRLNSVPAGASDWDVPYPFQQGEGPSQYRHHWEKERLKQLLSQLAVLIKGAKRSAAARTYLQQHSDSRPSVSPPIVSGQTSYQQQPIADVSLSEQRDVLACHFEVGDDTLMPTVSEELCQVTQSPAATPQTASLDDLITSILYNSIPRVSSSTNLTSFPPSSECPTPSPPAGSHTAATDTLPPDFQQLLAILRQSPSQWMTTTTDSPGVTVAPVSSSKQADPVPLNETLVASGAITDCMIDPTLLGESSIRNSDLINSSMDPAGRRPSTPPLLQSPIASTSSLFDPLTPREELCPEPDVYRPEQAEDPISAATLLLQIATSATSQATAQSKAQLPQPPASRFLGTEPQFPVPTLSSQQFPTSTATTTPSSSRASSAAPRQSSTLSAITPTAQIPSRLDQRRLNQDSSNNRALKKHELIRRARDRRQQLLKELESAKVELWEAAIEQGVLNHLMKDHGCL